jgi:hypothetical protein
MRRDLALFLVTGSLLVLSLETRPVLACVKEGLQGPYAECGVELATEPLGHAPAPALAAATEGTKPPAVEPAPAWVLPVVLVPGF